MNNAKLYTRMLIKFRDSQGPFAELFAAAQQDADPLAAARDKFGIAERPLAAARDRRCHGRVDGCRHPG